MLSLKTVDSRRSSRVRKAGAVYWRGTPHSQLEMGWLLEGSDDGFACAWRGKQLPAVGTIIGVTYGLAAAPEEKSRAVVRRVTAVHDNLAVIAAELLHLRPFPPAAAVEAKGESLANTFPCTTACFTLLEAA